MSNTGWVAIILVVVILLGAGWWFMAQSPATPTDTTAAAGGTQLEGTPTPDNGMVGGDAVAPTTGGAEVHYTATGFTPKSVTIKAGEKVTFINDTSGAMWVAADEHPTHTEYDSTDRATHCSGSYAGATPFDQCQAGSSYTFVFTKAGSFEYHNHSAAQFSGMVVVQ